MPTAQRSPKDRCIHLLQEVVATTGQPNIIITIDSDDWDEVPQYRSSEAQVSLVAKRNRPGEPKQFDRTNGLFNVFLRDLADEGFGVDRQWQGIDFMFQQFSVFEYSS